MPNSNTYASILCPTTQNRVSSRTMFLLSSQSVRRRAAQPTRPSGFTCRKWNIGASERGKVRRFALRSRIGALDTTKDLSNVIQSVTLAGPVGLATVDLKATVTC